MRDLPRLPHGAQAISHGRAIIDNVAKAFKPILGANIKKMSGSRGHAGGICLGPPPAAGGGSRHGARLFRPVLDLDLLAVLFRPQTVYT